MDIEIEEVKQEIRKVQQQIDDAERYLTRAATDVDVAYWRKEKLLLRKKEEQLRKKEEQLRKKEEQLWKKEEQLRKKEEQLRRMEERKEKVLLLKADISWGEPPSKKAKLSESTLSARNSYYGKLLEAPAELPRSVRELREFLSQRTVKLPLASLETCCAVGRSELVEVCTSEAEFSLAVFIDFFFYRNSPGFPDNEATSSSELANLTGRFLSFLNVSAPPDRQLRGFGWVLDSPNPGTSKSASKALRPLLRPDFQLFVGDVLILRWENKIDKGDFSDAMEENVSKLRVWSPLYYGTLPYVIGGRCAGRQFQWLKLSPNGKIVVVEPISEVYDLNLLGGVAKFLHSTLRMHCLLQQLQRELADHMPVRLYNVNHRDGGGEVVVYPDFVHKVVKPPLEGKELREFKSMYASITDSIYLIQLKHIRTRKGETVLQLEPVGDPYALPRDVKDFAAAIHDILHGLADLHKQGYTHKDLRWPNFIKVNVLDEWKWVIIDLEGAGPDREEYEGDGLVTWDERTLEDRNGKKIYTKASDMYQLGKLIVEWFDRYSAYGEEGQDLYKLGEKMQRERPAVRRMLKEICRRGCERCAGQTSFNGIIL